MALPNSGITTSMVASAIGAATNDVGQLCTHPNVNKWSKWKPIRYPSVSPINETNLQDVNYGLTANEIIGIVNYNKSTGYAGTAIDSTASWAYAKPRGVDTSGYYNEPFRLGDFRNYNHNAAKAITDINNIIISNKNVDNYLNNGTDLLWHPSFKYGAQSFETVGSVENGEIHLYMLKILSGSQITDGNWRMGIAIWHPTEKIYYIASSRIPIQLGLGSDTVSGIFVSLFQESTYVRNLLSNAAEGTVFNAIPFLGYKLLKNTTTNEFYFEGSNGRAFNFTEGETITITRQGYETNIYITFIDLATENDSGTFDESVTMTAPPTEIMGSLSKKSTSPQRIQIKFNSSVANTFNMTSAGTKIMLRKGVTNNWIDISVTSINGSSLSQTLSTSDLNTVIGSSAELQSYIASLPTYTGQEILQSRVRLLNDYTIIGEQDFNFIILP